MNHIFTYKNLILLCLLFANFFLWLKLDFFIPELTGQVALFDFDNYIRLINDIRSGFNPYKVSHMQTLGPPNVFLYYFPFSFLDLNIARSLTTVMGIASGIASVFLISKNIAGANFMVWFLVLNLILFSSFPARFSLETGQPNLVLTLITTLMLTSKNHTLKAFFTSIAITIKPFFALTPFSFLKSNSNLFLKILLILLVFVVCSWFIISPFYYTFYLKNNLTGIIGSDNIIIGLDYYNQSYWSTLARFGILLSTKTFFSYIILIALIFIYRMERVELAIIIGLLFSYVSWQHYFVILFPIFIFAFKESGKIGLRTVLLSTLLFFWWIEFPWLHMASLNSYSRVLASHYFFSGLGLLIYQFFLIRYRQLKT